EYTQHIDMKVASGLSEEDAIADFGDPEELIKELLDVYHLNPNYNPSAVYTTEYAAQNNNHSDDGKPSAVHTILAGSRKFGSACEAQLSQALDKKKAKKNEKNSANANKAKTPWSDMTLPHVSVGALGNTVLSWCKTVLRWCLKLAAFCILIGAGFCSLALLASSAAMLVFVVTGYQIVGPFLAVLGCTLLSLAVTGMLMQYVFGIGGASA
ncbi:MAG: hypothetical protein IIU81_00585, partial [Peptococcaceae bacterium]|nr:hypothetical protein [Peptococcaceae bacterium]